MPHPAILRGLGVVVVQTMERRIHVHHVHSRAAHARMTLPVDDYLAVWIEAFLIDRKARGMSKNTILFYTRKLRQFSEYADAQAVKHVGEMDAQFLREFIIWMQAGHNPGGVHAAYRALSAFLRWYEAETDEHTPISRVKPPRMAVEPLEGVSLETVKALVKVCERGTFTGVRDRSIFYCLFDTGCRAREFLSINLDDLNQARGEILIRKGKGRKPRHVYAGRQSRKALRRYLKHRQDDNPALWTTQDGDRLSYGGLRSMLKRRAKQADIPRPALHDFRRGFALAMLRANVDVYTLAKLMGHEGIDVLKRYVKLTRADAEAAHRRASPVDNLY